MSAETDQAREVWKTAGDIWRNHRKVCPDCSRAARRRRPQEVCSTGAQLNAAYSKAQGKLTAAKRLDREADRAPLPGQGELDYGE